MKQSFLEYIGNEYSLSGYQRSNRLVLLRAFFSRIDSEGKVLVNDVIEGFSDFYKSRKEKGLITDVDADIVIRNIENSTTTAILALIKKHPYRVLNKKGYLSIIQMNKQDYFMLDERLMEALSEKDTQEILILIERKINLYYSKIDETINFETGKGKREKSSELMIEDFLFEKCHSELGKYCRDSKMLIVSEMEPIDFVGVKPLVGVDNEFAKGIKASITQYTSGMSVNKVSVNGDKVLMKNANTCAAGDSSLHVELKWNNNFNLAGKEYCYGDESLIIDVFEQGIFKNFIQFCTEHKLNYLKDLDGFDFKKLLGIRGFGATRVKKITEKYNAVRNINCKVAEGMNKESKHCISKNMESMILKSIDLEYYVEEDCVLTAEEKKDLEKLNYIIETIGVQVCQMVCLYPAEFKPILHLLDDIAHDIVVEEENIIRLKSVFEGINEFNLALRIQPIVMAYTADEGVSKELLEAFDTIEIISDLENILMNYGWKNKSVGIILKFMEWLNVDMREALIEFGTSVSLYPLAAKE